MSGNKLLSVSKAECNKFLAGDGLIYKRPSDSVRSLRPDNELYRSVEVLIDRSLNECEHTFRMEKLEILCAPSRLSTNFKRNVAGKGDSDVYFLFHGTKPSNHDSIFDNGFLIDEEHFGDTDRGYIGKGVYLSPHVEYSASYIKDTKGIKRFQYNEPVRVGVTFQMLGCLAIVGTSRRLNEKAYSADIPVHLDSHWAWVDSSGNPTANSSEQFAVEYAIRQTSYIYPRFRVSLKRITREVIWTDPNIHNKENSGYVQKLKATEEIFLYSTSQATKALKVLKKKKTGTEYRAITAGSGGKEFVSSLRTEGIHCKVLVFCQSVDYHKTWATSYHNVEVTRETSSMMKFATWR